MAKKAYVGINNLSKNGKQIYIGVSNLSKKAVKGYIGVGNLSKIFWQEGEGGVVPEYDYVAGQTYTIHNFFDAEKTMDLCFDEFSEKAILLQLDVLYSHCKYFIDNWELIKELMLNEIEGLQIEPTNISCVMYCNKSDYSGSNYTYLALRIGDDTFPKAIGIQSINFDDFNSKYYRLATRPTPPSSDYRMYIYTYSDHYEISPAQADTSTMIQLGLWTQNNTSRLGTTLTSFGMKED